MKYHELDQAIQKCRNWKVMAANCLAPINKCAYKKAQQQNKEAFQDGDSTDKIRHCLSSKTAGEQITPAAAPLFIKIIYFTQCFKKKSIVSGTQIQNMVRAVVLLCNIKWLYGTRRVKYQAYVTMFSVAAYLVLTLANHSKGQRTTFTSGDWLW